MKMLNKTTAVTSTTLSDHHLDIERSRNVLEIIKT